MNPFFRRFQAKKYDLRKAVNRPPSLIYKALTISDDLQDARLTKTPKRQAVGSNPAGCAEDPSGATKR